ncbi:MAG TPA: FtsQ-type POTRA domain-containing protein [Candidatus Eisenbacteria bacterium]|jgi:cell division protein FtsQ
MSLYQGRALREARPRRRGGRLRRIAVMLGVLLVLAALAHVPWQGLRGRFAVVTGLRVTGGRYLDAARVLAIAGLTGGEDLLTLDLERVRQRLLLDPRVARAEVRRRGLRGVEVEVEERVPVLRVEHGVPWEIDSAGVLLAPLEAGVTADVPLLSGPRFDALPAGTRLTTLAVGRGLAWIRALSARELELGARISELDVSDPLTTGLLLMSGTRVLCPAWPPGVRTLSALRVVLSDLERRGTQAQEVDLRYERQVIVRPPEKSTPAGSHSG